MQAKIKIDTREFDKTLKQYVEYSKRDIPTILNTKAFYIARAAVAFTPKADKGKIRNALDYRTGAIVGKIINKRRGLRGEKGLYGDAMLKAALMLRAARLRAVAYLKSGWIPAIKKLEPLAEKPGRAKRAGMSDASKIQKPKGNAVAARPGLFSKAIITNLATAKNTTTKDPLDKYGLPGLKQAFDNEVQSMRDYIERKMRASAKACGIKTN